MPDSLPVSMNAPLIHIGLHKTATGVLQRQFFPAVADANVLTTRDPGFQRFVMAVTRTDPAFFDADAARALLATEWDSKRANILSNESFSALPYSGVIEAGLDHRTPILQNLKAAFPEAKVLLVIRKQDGMARSLYRQYLKSGGTRSIERFYGRGSGQPPLVPLERFLYKRYVDYLTKLYPDSVLVLPYEAMRQDPDAFLTRLTEFFEIQCPQISLKNENVTSLSPAMLNFSRFLNLFFRSLLNPAGVVPGYRTRKHGISRRISPVQALQDYWPFKPQSVDPNTSFHRIPAEIFVDCHEDNRLLDEAYGLNLAAFGYYPS